MPEGQQLSEKARNDFLTWVSEYYGYDWTFLQLPDVLLRFGDKNNQWYQYWAKNVWTPAHPAEEPPAPVGKTPTLEEESLNQPYAMKEKLPENVNVGGKELPVNYTRIGDASIEMVVADPVTGAEKMQEVPLTLYAPVPSLGELDDKSIKALYGNIYGVLNDGTIYNEGKPMSREELQDALPYDPVKGELTPEGLAGLTELVSYASMLEWSSKNIQTEITDEMDAIIKQRASDWGKGKPSSAETLNPELEKMTAAYQMAHPKEEAARLKEGQVDALKEKFPGIGMETQQGIDAGVAGLGGFEAEGFATEEKMLDAQLKYYQPKYEEYKDMLAEEKSRIARGETPSAGLTATQQMGMSAARIYEMAQERLAQVKGGALQQVGNFQPSTSAKLSQAAIDFGIPAEQISSMAQRYINEPDANEFRTVGLEDKKRLASLGLKVENEGGGQDNPFAEQERAQEEERKKFAALAAKANERVNYARRRVSI